MAGTNGKGTGVGRFNGYGSRPTNGVADDPTPSRASESVPGGYEPGGIGKEKVVVGGTYVDSTQALVDAGARRGMTLIGPG